MTMVGAAGDADPPATIPHRRSSSRQAQPMAAYKGQLLSMIGTWSPGCNLLPPSLQWQGSFPVSPPQCAHLGHRCGETWLDHHLPSSVVLFFPPWSLPGPEGHFRQSGTVCTERVFPHPKGHPGFHSPPTFLSPCSSQRDV